MKNKLIVAIRIGSNVFSKKYLFYLIIPAFLLLLNAETIAAVYAKLTRKIEPGYYVLDAGKINFVFDEPYIPSTDTIRYYIYKYPSNVLQTNTLSVHRGFNKFELSVGLSSGMYILEVRNTKGEQYFLRFKI